MNQRYRAYWDMSIAAVLIGSSVVAGKLTTMRIPVFLSQAASLTIALMVLVPMLLHSGVPWRKLRKADVLILLLQAFLGMFLFRVLMLYGLKFASAAETGIVTSLTPAIIVLLSFVFLKERLSGRLALGILSSLLGLVVMKAPALLSETSAASRHESFIGILLVFLAVVGEAMLVILRKKSSSSVSALLGSTYVTFFSFLMFLPFAAVEAVRFDFAGVDLTEIGLIVYYGVFVTAVAYILWFRGVSRVPAGTAAVYTGCIPVSTLVLSYGILHEPFSFAHAAGAAFVFAGILLVSDFGKGQNGKRAARAVEMTGQDSPFATTDQTTLRDATAK